MVLTQGEELPHHLARRVGPSRDGAGSQYQIALLAQRDFRGFAIDLGTGEEHDAIEREAGGDGGEEILHSLHVVAQGFGGPAGHEVHAHRCCQMVDPGASLQPVAEQRQVTDRADGHFQTAALAGALEVRHPTGRKVIKNAHDLSAVEQRFHQVRAYEPGAARNQNGLLQRCISSGRSGRHEATQFARRSLPAGVILFTSTLASLLRSSQPDSPSSKRERGLWLWRRPFTHAATVSGMGARRQPACPSHYSGRR